MQQHMDAWHVADDTAAAPLHTCVVGDAGTGNENKELN